MSSISEMNTYYGTSFDCLHYCRLDDDGTSSQYSWNLDTDDEPEIIEESLEHPYPNFLQDLDEEYIREVWGCMANFLKTHGDDIKTGDEVSSDDCIEELKKRFEENTEIIPLEDNLAILNYLLISNVDAKILINVGDVLKHLLRSSKELIQQSFLTVRKTLELIMRNPYYMWIDKRAKVLFLLTQHKTFIINTPLSIIKNFLDMLLKEMLAFEFLYSAKLSAQMLQNIHEVYVEFMDNSEIIVGITSVNMVTELHLLLRYSNVILHHKNLIMEVLTIVCSHNHQASKALLENGIHSTLAGIDQIFKYKPETIKVPIVSLIWAMLPSLPQCSLLDKVRDVTLRTDDLIKMAVWCIEGEQKIWTPVIPPFNYLIEKSYRKQKKEFRCNDLDVIFTVDFSHMLFIDESTSERMCISRHEIDGYRVLNLKKTKKESDVPHINGKFVEFAYKLLTRRFSLSLYHQEQYYCLEALMTLLTYVKGTQYQILLFPKKPSINVWRADQTVRIMKTLLKEEHNMYRKMLALQILYVLEKNHEELYKEIYNIYGIKIFLHNFSEMIKFPYDLEMDFENLPLDIEFKVWMKHQIGEILSNYEIQVEVYPKFAGKSRNYQFFDREYIRDELEYYKTMFFDGKHSNLIQRRSEAIKYFLKFLTEPLIVRETLARMQMFLEVFTGIPTEATVHQKFEIIRQPLRELVEKVGYFLAANEDNKKKDFTKIYTTSLCTIEDLNNKYYEILIDDSIDRKKHSVRVKPFMTVQFLEFYAYSDAHPNQFTGWSRRSNFRFLYEYGFRLNGNILPSGITVHEAVCRYGITGHEKNIFQRKYRFTYFRHEKCFPKDDPVIDSRNRELLHCLRYRRSARECKNLTEDVKNALHLTDVLYGMNKYWTTAYPTIQHEEYIIDPQDFVNNSLDDLVTNCLKDPFAALIGKLPSWIKYVTDNCPFIFSLKTRIFAFKVLYLDRVRAFMAVMDQNDEYIRHYDESIVIYKTPVSVEIQRKNVLNDLMKIVSYTSPGAFWNVKFKGEIGAGRGLTRELFTMISKELQKTEHLIWASHELTDTSREYVQCNLGLYPRFNPYSYFRFETAEDSSLCDIFNLIGVLLGRALIGGNLLVLPLAPSLFKWLLNEQSLLSLEDVKYVNFEVYTVLRNMQYLALESERIALNKELTQEEKDKLNINSHTIQSYGLDFVLPGYENIELSPGGKHKLVTLENVTNYIERVKHALLYTGTRRQFYALKNAFNSVVPLKTIKMFHPEELQTLLCGEDENDIMQWSLDKLKKHVKLDGYTIEDNDIQNLFSVLSCASSESRSKFLEFVTGSSRLPVGGFQDLNPPLLIVRVTADGYPTAQTCFHQLNLPSGMTKAQISIFIIDTVPEALGYFGLV